MKRQYQELDIDVPRIGLFYVAKPVFLEAGARFW
jgi:hypothetical protein